MDPSPASIDLTFVRLLLDLADLGGDAPPVPLERVLAESCRLLEVDLIYTVMPCEAGWQKIGVGPDGELGRVTLPRLTGIVRHVISKRSRFLETRLTSPHGTFHRHQDGWPGLQPTSYVALPIHRRGRLRGVLVLLRCGSRPSFAVEDLGRAEVLADALALRCENEDRVAGLDRLARTDGLTQIANYRCMRESLAQAMARADQTAELLSIIMVDVDNLKKVNDRHGHLAGSEVLRRLARVLARNVRGSDVVAKYGGDEFVVILPNTPREGAVSVAERLRQAIARESIGPTPEEKISCSCGIACFPEDGSDYVGLISAADRALFRAKLLGRDAVVSAEDEDRRAA